MKYILNILLKKKILKNIDIEFAIFITNFNKHPLSYIIAAYLSYNYRLGNIFLPIINIYKLNLLTFYKKESFFKKIIKKYIKQLKNLKINNIKTFTKEIYKLSNIISKKKKTPFIIYKKKIYLYKNWYYENKIIDFFINSTNKLSYNFKKYYSLINFKNLFLTLRKINLNKWQKITILTIILNKLTFIFGKPGTGKSTLIYYIIDIILKNYIIHPIIQIISSTSKSTIKIKELLTKYNKNILKKINNITTIHKFLGINIYNNISKKDNIYFKYINILIIDEAIMINLNLMYYLIKIFKKNKNIKIIFIGDPNQLFSIEVGGILNNLYTYTKNKFYSYQKIKFFELILKKKLFTNKYKYKALKNKKLTYLNDNICTLKYNYRFNFNSGIKNFINAINKNNINFINDIISSNKFPNIKFFNLNNNINYIFFLNYYINIHNIFFKKIISKSKNLLFYYNKIQLLCILNKGPFGVKGLNNNIEKFLINKKIINNNLWYKGRPIMITQNNEILNLSNGDIGITYKSKKYNYKVGFLKLNKIKYIPIFKLTDYISAWSLTIHKSQGLEFDHVILVLPNYFHKLLSKQLIYTALSRAKEKITIFANKNIFFEAIKNNIIINSGLKDKLNKNLIY